MNFAHFQPKYFISDEARDEEEFAELAAEVAAASAAVGDVEEEPEPEPPMQVVEADVHVSLPVVNFFRLTFRSLDLDYMYFFFGFRLLLHQRTMEQPQMVAMHHNVAQHQRQFRVAPAAVLQVTAAAVTAAARCPVPQVMRVVLQNQL